MCAGVVVGRWVVVVASDGYGVTCVCVCVGG